MNAAQASRLLRILLSLILLSMSGQVTSAQESPPRDLQSHPQWPRLSLDEAGSPRATVEAFFRVISAPKGGKINVDRLNALFLPSGRIEVPVPAGNGREADVVFMTPARYASLSDRSTAGEGFFDHVLALHIEKFGAIAHVFASYASSVSPEAKPFVRGMKSFQMLKSGSHWYIAQVCWDRESADVSIPSAALKDREE